MSRLVPWTVLIVAGLLMTGPATGQQVGPPSSYEVVVIDPADVSRAVLEDGEWTLELRDEDLVLALEVVSLRAEDFQLCSSSQLTSAAHAAPKTYRGKISGDDESLVCLSVCGPTVRGFVRSGEGWRFVQALAPGDQREPYEHMVYTEEGIDPYFHAHCGTTVYEHVERLGIELATDDAAWDPQPMTEVRVIELAVDADHEYFLKYGAGATAQIEAVLNEVDAIFEADLALTISITSINIWDDEPDPYTTTDPNALLVEFRDHWNANFGGVIRDTAHLFTGKDLDDPTIGIAYTGAICVLNFAYGVSQDLADSALMPLLVAHEIGHNLGANHDASGSSPRYIMYPSLGPSNLDEFSPQSITDVSSLVAATSCLAVEEQGTPDPDPAPPPSGGGGGGGPVDPLLIALIAVALFAARKGR